MDHDHGAPAATPSPAPPPTAVQWPLLVAIAAATLAICLASTILPGFCLRFFARRADAADAAGEEKEKKEGGGGGDDGAAAEAEAERQRRRQVRQRRVALVTGCLTSVGAGVILAMCFIGLMPAAASAYSQLCAGNSACHAASGLVPSGGSLAFCLILWLARTLVEMARRRGQSEEETKQLLTTTSVACCSDVTPSALQDPTTACFITAALMLKAIVEGLALPSMLRAASPAFMALGKCLHEACCGLVLGLAWADASAGVGRWGLVAVIAYSIAASGSILLGGLTASVHTVAGTAVQFGLLIMASGAALQAAFVHILPRLPEGPASPALVLAGMLAMALVAALHHSMGHGHG